MVRAVRPGRATRTRMRRQAPSRFGFEDEYAVEYLARQLVPDRLVDLRQLAGVGGEVGAAAGFLRELTQDELRFLEFSPPDLSLSQANRVDRGLGAFGEIEHFVELDQTRRVVAVRQQDDRLPPDVGGGGGLALSQLLQRNVDRVVQRCRSVGGCGPDGFLERRTVAGERGEDPDLAVEVDDFRLIVLVELAREADCRFLRNRHALFHAGAGVEQQRQRDGRLRPGKERQILTGTILVDLEVLLSEIGDVSSRSIGDRDVQRHQLDARAEPLLLLLLRRLLLRRLLLRRRLLLLLLRAECRRQCHRQEKSKTQARSHGVSRTLVVGGLRGPRAVRPDRVVVTSRRLGGISVSGRA